MSEALREEIQEEIQKTAPAPEAETVTPPMAWHGFLLHFLLYLLPVCAVFQAAWILTGRVYYSMEIREQIYAGICGMRALDRGLCLMLLGAAVLLLAARWKLKRMKKSGVTLLLGGLGISALAWALYGAVRFLIAGLSPLSISIAGQCAGYIVLLLMNRCYYARRRALLRAENEGRKE